MTGPGVRRSKRPLLASYLGHTLNFCPNLVQYRFKNMYLRKSLNQSSAVILSTLLTRVKGETNFISSDSKIVTCLRCRQCDPSIIERTIGRALCPFTALYRSFIKRCTLTTRNKAAGAIWRALSKPPQRRQGPDPRPLWLLVGAPSAFGPKLAYRLRVAQPTLIDVPIYIYLIYHFITTFVCVPPFYDLSALVGLNIIYSQVAT